MRIALGIIGGIFLLLVLLLWAPLRFDFATDGKETTLRLRWLFLKIPLLPQREEPEKKDAAAPTEEKPKRPEQEKKRKKDPLELAHMGFLLLQSSWGPLRRLLRSIVVEDLALHWAVTGEDVGQAAVSCGRYNWAVGTAYAAASLLLTMRPADLAVFPDYLGEEDRLDLRFTVRVRPGMALVMGAAALGIFLWRYAAERMARPRREEPAPHIGDGPDEQTTEMKQEAVC